MPAEEWWLDHSSKASVIILGSDAGGSVRWLRDRHASRAKQSCAPDYLVDGDKDTRGTGESRVVIDASIGWPLSSRVA